MAAKKQTTKGSESAKNEQALVKVKKAASSKAVAVVPAKTGTLIPFNTAKNVSITAGCTKVNQATKAKIVCLIEQYIRDMVLQALDRKSEHIKTLTVQSIKN